MNFRYDINGLRAVAVLGVILYHFNITIFHGGFAGVDVFFVISGFLMTSIIFGKIEAEKFSLKGFYLDRIRRIVPMLVFVCLVLLVFGFLALSLDVYQTLSKHIKYSLRFMSNILYVNENGYFDIASHNKWLLHTWSLAVEWQFYIIYPLLILLLKKLVSINKTKFILIVLTILSFILCVETSFKSESRAFFLLQYRAWEMLAGGLVFLFPVALTDKNKIVASVLGLTLILSSFFIVNTAMIWPGYLALIPVLGTVLVIAANNQTLPVLNSRLFQFTGKISYSLYLWHWPIYVALYYFSLNSNYIYIALGIALSFILSTLSYRYIEIPFTDKKNIKRFLLLIAMFVLAVAGSYHVYATRGLLYMANPNVRMIYAAMQDISRYQHDCLLSSGEFKDWCVVDKSKPVDLIAIGDSHSDSITTSISDGLDKNVKFISYAGCLIIPSIKRLNMYDGYECGKFAEEVTAQVKQMDKNIPLLITERTTGYLKNAPPNSPSLIYFTEPYTDLSDKFINEIQNRYIIAVCDLAKDRDVYVVMPIPEMKKSVPRQMMDFYKLGIEPTVSISRDEYDERHAITIKMMENARDLCGIKLLDPTEYLCDEQECSGIHNTAPIYYDDNHLSESGNKLLTPMFNQIWQSK